MRDPPGEGEPAGTMVNRLWGTAAFVWNVAIFDPDPPSRDNRWCRAMRRYRPSRSWSVSEPLGNASFPAPRYRKSAGGDHPAAATA
jgi:hypothetical protein